jgi:hypothetical protein
MSSTQPVSRLQKRRVPGVSAMPYITIINLDYELA